VLEAAPADSLRTAQQTIDLRRTIHVPAKRFGPLRQRWPIRAAFLITHRPGLVAPELRDLAPQKQAPVRQLSLLAHPNHGLDDRARPSTSRVASTQPTYLRRGIIRSVVA
jgi:hypothetical protein